MTRTLGALWAAIAIAALPAAPALAQATNPKPFSKLQYSLEETVQRCRQAWASGERDMSRFANPLAVVSADGFVEILVHAADPIGAPGQADLRRLGARAMTELGAAHRLQLPRFGMIHASVPFQQLEAIAALPWVAAITPAVPGKSMTGAIQSEGVAAQRALPAQQRGITGAGIKVGVVSDGAVHLKDAQKRGELGSVTVLDRGKGDEGTAMLEIVHDLAPGAELLFHGAGSNPMTLANAMLELEHAGAQIIAEDVGTFGEPVFQQGLLASIGDTIAGRRTAVFSAAGNSGTRHAPRVRAIGTGTGPDGVTGPFEDCGERAPGNAIAIAPGSDTTFDVVLRKGARFVLQWSEPRTGFPTPAQGGFTDLDLFIMDASLTRCLAKSVARQGNGRGDTIEAIPVPDKFAGMRAKVVVNLFGSFGAAQPPVLDLVWDDAVAVDRPERQGSLTPDANYTGRALSIAAFDASGLRGSDLEDFSSAGPVQLGLTTLGDGSRGPGPEAVVAPAPNFTAVDGVSVSGAGGFHDPTGNPARSRFFGTSAAAPHAAACAALALQALGPNTSVADLVRRLTTSAIDLGAPGPDVPTGFGLIDCDAASRP